MRLLVYRLLVTSPQPVLQALLSAAHALSAAVDADLDALGLSLAKVGVLRHVQDAPLRLSEIAERQHCGKSNMTALVDRLERDDCVKRQADPGDRRVYLVELTPSGRAALREAAAVLERHELTLSRRLGPSIIGMADALGRLEK